MDITEMHSNEKEKARKEIARERMTPCWRPWRWNTSVPTRGKGPFKRSFTGCRDTNQRGRGESAKGMGMARW